MELEKLRTILLITFALFICTVFTSYAASFTVGVETSNASPVVLVDEDGKSINSTNPISVSIGAGGISSLTDGRAVVVTAGTAVKVSSSSLPFASCDVQAEENNTGDIVIGSSTVKADLANRQGILLTPATSFHFADGGDLENIYIDSEVNGDGVTFFCQS